MKERCKIFQVIFFVAIACLSCNTNKSNEQNTPPPPPPDNRCSTLKANTYYSLQSGELELVFSDTFQDAIKGYYLDSIIEKKYKLNHVRIFNSDFANCVQPIMDSAIAAKYGANAKDSIINEAYRLTEIVYKKENEE